MMFTACFARNTTNSLIRTFLAVPTRSLSSLIDVKFDEKHGYAVISMQKKPVNSLNYEMFQSLSETLSQLEKKECKGIILTSALPGVFCAGLDIKEFYQSTEEKMIRFWSSLQTLWLQLYGSKMASVALINVRYRRLENFAQTNFEIIFYQIGHSPAGGCVLALCCDFRIIVDGKFKIGLNETRLGIVAPPWIKNTFINTVGIRTTERALQLGTLFSVQDALKVGLVDRIVPDVTNGLVAAESELKEFLQIPAKARYLSKMLVREDVLKSLADNREADVNFFLNFAMSQQVQAGLGKYLESMAKKNL